MAEERNPQDSGGDRTAPVVIPPTEVSRSNAPQPDPGKAAEAERIPDGQMEDAATNTGAKITDGEGA